MSVLALESVSGVGVGVGWGWGRRRRWCGGCASALVWESVLALGDR